MEAIQCSVCVRQFRLTIVIVYALHLKSPNELEFAYVFTTLWYGKLVENILLPQEQTTWSGSKSSLASMRGGGLHQSLCKSAITFPVKGRTRIWLLQLVYFLKVSILLQIKLKNEKGCFLWCLVSETEVIALICWNYLILRMCSSEIILPFSIPFILPEYNSRLSERALNSLIKLYTV